MLDIGWTEMFVVAVVAVVVIGPKDLPAALRTAGRWARKVRGAAREFQNSIDDMVNQAELEELRKNANEIRNFDANRYISDTIDPTGAAGPTGAGSSTAGSTGVTTESDSSTAATGPQDSAPDRPDSPKEREANA